MILKCRVIQRDLSRRRSSTTVLARMNNKKECNMYMVGFDDLFYDELAMLQIALKLAGVRY